MSSPQSAALDYYATASLYVNNYTSLASGWPSDTSVQEAQVVFTKFHTHWTSFGVDERVQKDIKKQLQEAPLTLFTETIVPCLNILSPKYIEWLDSKEGRGFCGAHIGLQRSVVKTKAKLDNTDDYLHGW